MTGELDLDYRSINQWAEGIEELYKDSILSRSPEELWLGAMNHCSAVGEAIRRTHCQELMISAAHAFVWMLSFVNKCNAADDDPAFNFNYSFNDIVYLKYPRLCGHCTKPICMCDSSEKDGEANKVADYVFLYDAWKKGRYDRFNISDWLDLFYLIYKGKIYLQRLDDIGFHFLEEAGEEARAVCMLVRLREVIKEVDIGDGFFEEINTIDGLIGKYAGYYDEKSKKILVEISSPDPEDVKKSMVKARMETVIEFADTFSLFCGVLLKVRLMAENQGVPESVLNLEYALQNEYGRIGEKLKCPACGSEKCRCFYFPDRDFTSLASVD